jgi:hypothetical protein
MERAAITVVLCKIEVGMNKYLIVYNKLIEKYRCLVLRGYVESHHILPRCMGGTNEISNLVDLPPKAHYVAHHLLHKAYPDNIKLAYAFGVFGTKRGQVGNERSKIFTARMYHTAKITLSEARKNDNQWKVNRSQLMKAKFQDPDYAAAWKQRNLELTQSQTWLEAVTRSNKVPRSQEWLDKMTAINRARTQSPEFKLAQSMRMMEKLKDPEYQARKAAGYERRKQKTLERKNGQKTNN